MVTHLRTFRGRKVTRQEPSGMVAHLRMFRAIMDSGCRMPPPPECCVRSDELTVPMRSISVCSHELLCLECSRAPAWTSRSPSLGMCGHVCARALLFKSF